MNAEEKNAPRPQPAQAEQDARDAGNPPVSPVETFDLGKVEKDRRMFQNGDTDRDGNGR